MHSVCAQVATSGTIPKPSKLHMMRVETMQVYLEGELERGIVPLESAWMHGRGCGEDGCLLMLQKMNLEVLQK